MPARIRPKSESSKLNRLLSLGGESATNQHRDSGSERVIYSTNRSLLPARIYEEPQAVQETLPDHINERRLSAAQRQVLMFYSPKRKIRSSLGLLGPPTIYRA